MDAISFVSGERPNNLRVKSLSDLIYGANVNQPVGNSSYVTAAFQLKDGKAEESIIEFTRTVKGSECTYQINGKVRAIFIILELSYVADIIKCFTNATFLLNDHRLLPVISTL